MHITRFLVFEMLYLNFDQFKEMQNENYKDPKTWHSSTVVDLNPREKCMRRYEKMFTFYGLSVKELKILDVGCSLGFFSYEFGKYGKVFGIDYSDTALQYARKCHMHHNVQYFLLDASKPDYVHQYFRGDIFDFIFLREFHPLTRNIEHINSHKIIFGYLKMLRPGGIVILEHVSSKHLQNTIPIVFPKRFYVDCYFTDMLVLACLLRMNNLRIFRNIMFLLKYPFLYFNKILKRGICKTWVIQKLA